MRYEIDFKLTLQQLSSDALLLCRDPLGEQFTFDRVYQAVNDAALDMCIKTHMIKDTLNMELKTDQIFYDLQSLAESSEYLKSYGFPIRLTFNGVSTPALWPTALAEIDLFSNSQLAPGGVRAWHLDSVSPGRIAIYGKPTTEGFENTAFVLDSDVGLIRQISQDDERLSFTPEDTALRDIAGPVNLVVPRDADGNIIRVLVGVSEDNNLQCTYIALPDYMTTPTATPDTIPAKFHEALTYRAAARLLEEGNSQDFQKAIEFNYIFEQQTRNAIAEIYREDTQYDSCIPA